MIEMTITKSTIYINIFTVTDEEVNGKKFDEDNCWEMLRACTSFSVLLSFVFFDENNESLFAACCTSRSR